MNVGILVFDNAEVLDFAGPYEVFTTASRIHARRNGLQPALFDVFTVAKSGDLVRARAGLSIHPDHRFSDHPAIDLLLIPGGDVAQALADPEFDAWIRRAAKEARLTASICTGAFLLAKAGMLDGKRATTHWEDIDDLRVGFPGVEVMEGKRWIDEGNIVTSAGISAGIDMSLHLVERLAGRELALATARQMDFDWTENGNIA